MIKILLISYVLFAGPHFETGKSEPLPELVDIVLSTCQMIENEAKIIVEGHTDVRGGDSYNLKLSKNRAESVKKLLKEKCGVEDDKITTVGMGKNFPVSEKHDDNRRVVLHLIQNKTKVVVISESKNVEVLEGDAVEKKEAQKEKVVPHEWHITGFVSNGFYDLSVSKSNNSATVFLNRSWTSGLLIEKRVYNNLYLGGGGTFDGSVILGIGVGF